MFRTALSHVAKVKR